jgi:murein DD-endopeptidase MepM/ murein hydrolase activator NlpD
MARHGTLGIADLLYKNLSASMGANEKKSNKTPGNDPASTTPVPSQASPDASDASHETEREISDLQLPISAPISSVFGLRRDPFSHKATFHKGLDLAAPEGMQVVPALAGTVISAEYENGYGNTVLVQHAEGIQTRYAHLASMNVKVGDTVDSKHILGTVGNTGRSTGSHLHFEVMRMGKAVDPLLSLGSTVSELSSSDL